MMQQQGRMSTVFLGGCGVRGIVYGGAGGRNRDERSGDCCEENLIP